MPQKLTLCTIAAIYASGGGEKIRGPIEVHYRYSRRRSSWLDAIQFTPVRILLHFGNDPILRTSTAMALEDASGGKLCFLHGIYSGVYLRSFYNYINRLLYGNYDLPIYWE